MTSLANHLIVTGKKPSQLARELDVEPSTITRILKGERRPSPELAQKISNATGISVTELIFPREGHAA